VPLREPPGAHVLAGAQQVDLLPLSVPEALPLLLAALALALPFLALYRRILPSRALHHPVREDILRRVREKPGIHESLLARDMGLRHTHVQYHLRVLEESGVIETRRFGGLKCIFEMGRHSAAEKALAMSERGRSQDVLLAVSAEPGIAQRALARRLGMSESSIKWHLDRLAGSGMVTTERARGAKRAWPVASVGIAVPAAFPPSDAVLPSA
jgi:predicted transcriptional regulator